MKLRKLFYLPGLIFALMGITFLLIHITNKYILTITFYEKSGQPVTGITGEEVHIYKSIEDNIYFFSAAYLMVKMVLITIIMNTVLYLYGIIISFKKIFKAVVCAEFIFFLPATLKIYWFYHFYPQGTLSDWHHFYVLSILSYFKTAPAAWTYALQTINVFEIGYWFVLALGIWKVSKLSYDQCLRLVIIAYVPALIIWVTVITFCTLLLFPQSG